MYVSMKGMLQRANEGNYAVMAINCFNIETARAVINAAQELRAPIIVNIVQEHMVNHCDSALIAPIVKLLANRASVEVALNFDHGEDVGLLKKALQDGYSSVMVDASRYDLEGNIRMTREIVDFAKQFDASVEGEIGCMGASAGDNFTNEDMKTNPQQALRFAQETGVDALAISFGSSHGNYPKGYVPEFDFERLKEIKALLPVYGKYEKRFFRDIKDSISELESENITYEFLCKELGRPEDLIVNYYQEIDSHYLRKQLKRSRIIKITIIVILILAIGLFICRMVFLYNLYLDGKDAVITHETIVIE